MTKQAVGEAVSDLEQLGYTERAADPVDGRAKIIRLTDRGRSAQQTGFAIIADIEREWVERYGAEAVESMHSLLVELTGTRLALTQAA
jgi:DNA-binding MarR family transcriptional regulator